MYNPNSMLSAKLKRFLLLRRALGLVWQSAPGWTVANFTLIIAQGLLPVAALYLTKLIIDAVAAGLQSHNPDISRVLWLVIGLGGVTLAISLSSSLASLVGEAQGQAVTDHIQSAIHEKSVEMDLAYYEDPRYHDTLHRAQQEAPYRPTRIVNGLAQVSQGIFSLLALAGLLLTLHWLIAVILLIAVLPGMYVRLSYSRKLYAWQSGCASVERQASYYEWMIVGEPHAKEIRLFDLGGLFIRRFRELRSTLRRERLKLVTRRVLTELGMQAASTITVFAALGYIVYQTIRGAVTVGGFVMYYQAFQRGQNYLRDVISGLANLYEDSLFLVNLYEFFDLKPGIVDPQKPHPMPRPIERGIVFKRVGFHYAGSGHPVLQDITLSIRPGEHVAIVGANGAGKTTLAKLLCRLYDPTAGSITIDGIDIRDFETTDLRRQISVVFQDYAHYYLTARENIRMGNAALELDDNKLLDAARNAGADEVISKLPRGFDTLLGNWFEDGQELSIGEWQKMALARAFVRDSQIVIFDEPTSALDAFAEHAVFERFQRLAAGKTTILISHRLSTVRMADRICVLKDGRIAEAGTHEDLLRRGGEYARLFELQARNYR